MECFITLSSLIFPWTAEWRTTARLRSLDSRRIIQAFDCLPPACMLALLHPGQPNAPLPAHSQRPKRRDIPAMPARDHPPDRGCARDRHVTMPAHPGQGASERIQYARRPLLVRRALARVLHLLAIRTPPPIHIPRAAAPDSS